MIHDDDAISARLERLARETDAIGPRPDFAARVLQAVEREQSGDWLMLLVKPARRFLPVAAMAAVLAMLWAVKSETAMDDELAVSYGTMEIDW